MSVEPLKVGVAGLGTVGVGVVKLLTQQANVISQRSGRDIIVTSVSARDPSKERNVDLTALDWCHDPLDLAIKQNVDVVVELIGGESGVAKKLVEAAIHNSKLNKINNVEFVVGDMKKVFNEEFIKKYGKPNTIITDPPRDGMHKKVINQILSLMPKKIVYISCNSATQARDIAILKSRYKIIRSRAIDMFPQTHHIENVVLLEKR